VRAALVARALRTLGSTAAAAELDRLAARSRELMALCAARELPFDRGAGVVIERFPFIVHQCTGLRVRPGDVVTAVATGFVMDGDQGPHPSIDWVYRQSQTWPILDALLIDLDAQRLRNLPQTFVAQREMELALTGFPTCETQDVSAVPTAGLSGISFVQIGIESAR
jgi:hypothetical protein